MSWANGDLLTPDNLNNKDGVLYNVKEYGALGDGSTDDTAAIRAAIAAFGGAGGVLYFPVSTGAYCITEEISITKPVTLIGAATSEETLRPSIKFTGTESNTVTMFRASPLAHGFSVSNLFLDANDLAGYCLYQEGDASPALTRGGEFYNVTFRGYRTIAWVIGDATDTLNAAQFQEINAYDINLRGGATSRNANGIHVNAQNLEWLNIHGLHVDPRSSETRHHTNHIRQISGGVNVTGFLSTRAGTSSLIGGFAVHSRDQLVITGWRSEDRLLVEQAATTIRSPTTIVGLQQRSDDPAETTGSTVVMDLGATVGSVNILGARVNGVIQLGASTQKSVTALGVQFSRSGAGYSYATTQNQRGIFHDVDVGELRLRGTAPVWEILDETGTSLFKVDDGKVQFPRVTPSALSADTNDYDLGAGTFFRISATGATRTITGLAGGATGRLLVLVNVGTEAIVLTEQSGASAAANRIITSRGSVWLRENDTALLIWDVTTNRWRLLDTTGSGAFQTFGANDATPSVAGRGRIYRTVNSNPTTITTLDDGVSGQEVFVIFNDANTTVDFTGTNLEGNAGVDWTPTTNDHMHCIYDGTNWFCRISDNTA